MAKEYIMSRELKAQEEEIEKVEHPKHYNRDGAMECIDEMILIFGKEAVKNFCICNSWKYRYRAADKNGEEDLKKSDWYLQKYKELDNEETTKFNSPISTPTIINVPYYPQTWDMKNMDWWRDQVVYCVTPPGPSTVASDKIN